MTPLRFTHACGIAVLALVFCRDTAAADATNALPNSNTNRFGTNSFRRPPGTRFPRPEVKYEPGADARRQEDCDPLVSPSPEAIAVPVLKVSRPGCYPGRTKFARTMQAAVPRTMLNTALRRHQCVATVTATPVSSGMPWSAPETSIDERQ